MSSECGAPNVGLWLMLLLTVRVFTVTESGSVSPGPGGPSKDKLSVKTLSCAWREHEEIC